MYGSVFKKRNLVSESDTRSSDLNLDAICRGADFSIRFRTINVTRRYYGGETTTVGRYGEMPDFPGRVVISRAGGKTTISFLRFDDLRQSGFIDEDKTVRGVYTYSLQDNYEAATVKPYPWNGNVSHFSISRQNGKLVACMIFNPDGEDGDYYYTLIFTNPI